VCNGILPIDQLREFTGPASLVAKRIPQAFLEEIYGLKIIVKPHEEGGAGIPTGEEMLAAYAKARGFTRTGQGQPDESRAARHILKDYVNGKLLFCQPPPGNIDPFNFNRGLYDGHSLEKRRTPVSQFHQVLKSAKLDSAFFRQGQGNSAHLRMPFNYKYSEQGTASSWLPSGLKQSAVLALKDNVDLKDPNSSTSKKHFKHGKRGNGKRRADYFAD
jgi:large subunit GTPase 1